VTGISCTKSMRGMLRIKNIKKSWHSQYIKNISIPDTLLTINQLNYLYLIPQISTNSPRGSSLVLTIPITWVLTVFALVVHLVYEQEKGSVITKHYSHNYYYQGKLGKCHLVVKVEFGRKL